MYKELVKKIKVKLKPIGFLLKGDTFYIKKDNNWGLINFQKSRDSPKFTINIGISSTILRENREGISTEKPFVEDCHWRKRIGFFLAVNKDYWWDLDSYTNIEFLYDEMIKIVEDIAIPVIDQHISDKSLESEWLQGKGAGLTEFQIYVNLTTLLKLTGSDILSKTIEDIRKTIKNSTKDSFEYHLKELMK